MIVKITVHDNDFQLVLTRFAENIVQGLPYVGKEPKDEKTKGPWAMEWIRAQKRLCELFRETCDNTPENDRKELEQLISDMFAKFVRDTVPEDADYLTKRLRCQCVPSVTDQWNNGEDFYLFPTSYEGKILCF